MLYIYLVPFKRVPNLLKLYLFKSSKQKKSGNFLDYDFNFEKLCFFERYVACFNDWLSSSNSEVELKTGVPVDKACIA